MASDDNTTTPHTDDTPATTTSLRRRAFLSSGVATALGSGCIQQSQSLFGRSSPTRVSLTIKTTPADADARATAIARTLSTRLTTVGIDASIALRSTEELYRDVLLNQSFDLYVGTFPHTEDPDFLRPLLHSRFGGEPGWQNPFGYTNLELDDRLAAQRTESGPDRVETLRQIERAVVRDQPFTVVAFPDAIRTTHSGRLQTPRSTRFHTARRYLAAEPMVDTDTDAAADVDTNTGTAPTTTTPTDRNDGDGDSATDTSRRLRVTLSDSRPTKNLNPLAAEFRSGSTITTLLYDSVGRWIDGRVRPWLASDWTWSESPTSGTPRATVSLRDDLTWHDGTALTAADVAFTYRFLRDTSLGRADSPVPAPTYRGETSLVESVTAPATDRVELQFGPVSRAVATRAFTVPILPEHVWRALTTQATLAGVDTGSAVTRALVWNNVPPVGSGPLQFERANRKESLLLRRFDDHFLHRADETAAVGPYANGFSFDRLEFVVVPSAAAAVELVADGVAGFTGSPLTQAAVPRIGRHDGLELRVSQPFEFYHVGYNARTPPTSNTRFRRAVAHLVDKASIVDETFRGYADPAASPLARRAVQSRELQWEGDDPSTPFPGENGTLDVERARDLFRDAGYRYSDDGHLVVP